jgi:fluoride exporter
MWKTLMVIGTGGFIGSVSRFLASKYIQNLMFSSFPWGTFAVNITGCFLIGVFYGISDRGGFLTAEWRLFLTVGFCGGYTTFSTFAQENLGMIRDGEFYYFLLYTGLSIFLGLTATYLGNLITKIL